MTGRDLDALAETRVRQAGAVPAFKGYHGYPATLCVSINDAVVHGIPSARRLAEGDVVSLDMGVVLDGYYGDSALTVGVGAISAPAAALLQVTREALDQAIGRVRVGGRVSDLGHAVQGHVEAHVSRWSGSSSGTGSGPACTRSRRFRTTARRAAVRA